MRRRIAVLLAMGILAGSANAARADGALAMGLPFPEVNKGGFVYSLQYNKGLDESQDKALSQCKGIDNDRIPDRASQAQAACKILKAFRNQCASIAMNGDLHTPATGMGWSVAPTSVAAKSLALADCEKMRRGRGRVCVEDAAGCDGEAK